MAGPSTSVLVFTLFFAHRPTCRVLGGETACAGIVLLVCGGMLVGDQVEIGR
jgi:hypothetical protein